VLEGQSDITATGKSAAGRKRKAEAKVEPTKPAEKTPPTGKVQKKAKESTADADRPASVE
ncbi:MAG TPA: hypothetical protein VN285_04080, partial [Candidatus Deferrimicrobium sp.]|nr:hypothetical protein [Candidatus Deferrimicrobium sp.]